LEVVCDLFAICNALIDLEGYFSYRTPARVIISKYTSNVAHKTNYNARLSYYFYCSVRPEVLFDVIMCSCSQIGGNFGNGATYRHE